METVNIIKLDQRPLLNILKMLQNETPECIEEVEVLLEQRQALRQVQRLREALERPAKNDHLPKPWNRGA